MGLDDRDGQGAGQEEQGNARASMTPERQAVYDGVLSELEAGADEDSAGGAPKKANPKKGAGAGTRSSAPAPARRYGDDRDAPDADDEDAVLLDDDDGIVEGTEDAPRHKPPKKPLRRPVTPAASDDDDEEDEDAFADVDDDDDDAEDEDEPDDGDDEDTVVDEEADEKTQAKVQRAWKDLARKEARDKAADAQRRATFEREKAAFIAEWQPQIRQAQTHHALVQRAERDPIGALLEFGSKVCKLEGPGWSAASKQLYLRSPEAEKDPRAAAEAAQVRREMETSSSYRGLEEQIRTLTSKLEEKEQAEENARATKGYLKRAIAMAGDETPLLRKMAKTAPSELRQELHLLAATLAEENEGRAVHPRKLIRAWEKREAARLARFGVKRVSKAGGADADATKSKKGAGKTKPAQNGQNGAGAPVDRNALRAQVLDGMPEIALPVRGRAARA